MRLTAEQRKHNEDRIRAAIDRMLRGDVPPGRQCDVKTLAFEAAVPRAALYSTYRHLKDEFELRRDNLRKLGDIPDPRESQIANLKKRLTRLQERISKQQKVITELESFRALALSRIMAQHDEIDRLRRLVHAHQNVPNIGPSKPTRP